MGCGSGGQAPALLQLWAEVKAAFPEVEFLGICGDERHCPGSSDHCSGNALDIGTGSNDNLAWALADKVLNDRRARYIIHDARGRKAYWRGGAWFSSSGHDTHLHVSIDGALRDQTHGWGIADVVAPPGGGGGGGGGGSSYSPGPGYWEATAQHPIRQGQSGDGVKHVQWLLKSWGYPVGAIDGLAGPKFDAALRAFQADAGIAVDGVFGPQSRAEMEDRYYSRGRWTPPPASAVPPFPGTVRRGSKGPAVRAVQQRLADRGWRIAVDGIFGPKTEKVVKAFQAEKGLVVDGIAGPQTWHALWTARVT